MLLGLAACTKSAQIPFSAWLPAAMAAPTPVSSLVHSSTLVTAGVYLLFRFHPIFRGRIISLYILAIGGATILMAGIRAMLELDMKKIVALSTLRQLGVIITTLGAKLYPVAFIHLLSHAYFKALLFIRVGSIIHLSSDFQDLRKASISPSLAPISLRFNLGANLSLCAIPFSRGFFSKDLCIELFISSPMHLNLRSMFIFASMLTAAYSIRLVLLRFNSSNKIPTPI